MPYDAFGNKVGDDPLGGLGGGASAPSGIPGGKPPRRWPAVVTVLVAVAAIGVAAAVLGVLGAEDEPSGDPVPAVAEQPVPEAPADPERPAAPERPAPAQPARSERPAAAKPAQPPRGLQPGSLLRRANFTVAVRRLRAQVKGRPRSLRVEAERIDVQVVLRDGRMRIAQARWDGEIRVLTTTSTPIGGLRGFSWAAIDRGAPQRLVRGATGRARKPASSFNYAVLTDVGGLRWAGFLKRGGAFIAGPSGRIERQIGG